MAATDVADPWEHTSGFTSSNIASFRYDRTLDILEVDFLSGSTYAYDNVPPATHRAFQAALSKGEFFARQIKNRYASRRVS
jgi:hypothetical protein